MILIKKIINIINLTKFRYIIVIEFLTLILALLETIRPYIMGESIDKILLNDSEVVVHKIVTYSITILISSVFDYYQAILMSKTIFAIELKCSKAFLYSILREKTNRYSTSNEILLSDIPEVSKIAVQTVDIAVFNVISAAFVTYYCLKIHFSLTMVIFISLPLLYYINNYLGKKIEKLNSTHKNSIDELNYEISYLKEGVPAIRSLQAFDYLEKKFDKLIHNINKLKLRIASYLAIKNVIFEILNYVLYLSILILGIVLIYNKEITIGGFISFNTYSVILTKNFNALIEILYMEKDFKISYDRIYNSKTNNEVNIDHTDNDEHSIRLQNVSFSSENIRILNSITYDFPKKGLIFIIGKSGSGKTSLLKLMGGLISDFEGKISVNSKYSNILYLPQSPVIFKDSLYNNITLGKEVVSYDLVKIIEKLGLTGLTEKNRSKIDQSLDMVLSGGEKQRISFARALISNPDILLLDEFDSALDNASSDQLYKVIRAMSKKKLVLLATHNVERIESQDLYIMIDKGSIIQENRP